MADNSGWIKLHRVILDNPVVTKDSDHFFVWCYLLLNATHTLHDTMLGGERITLLPGQLITGRNKIAKATGVEPSKVRRVLVTFKTNHQIDQQSTRHGSLISILYWATYQDADQQSDQQVTNQRPTSDQQVTTIQERKNGKNGENGKNYSPKKEEERNAHAREGSYEDPWTGEMMTIPSPEEINERINNMFKKIK